MSDPNVFSKEAAELMEDAAWALADHSGRSVAELLDDLKRAVAVSATRVSNEHPTGFEADAKIDQDASNEFVFRAAIELHESLRAGKPDDRSDLARYYAIALTDSEKMLAWVSTWIAKVQPHE